ncbi:MAG: hypothetical protein Q9164_006551 [Protoblastenia rupestris]
MFEMDPPFIDRVDLWSLGLLTLRLIWEMPERPCVTEDCSSPLSPLADGWGGIIRGAVEELKKIVLNYEAHLFGKGKEPQLRPPISDDEFSYGKLKSEMPPCALVRLIDGLLQIDPDDRYDAEMVNSSPSKTLAISANHSD